MKLAQSKLVCLSKKELIEVVLSFEDEATARWLDPLDYSELMSFQCIEGTWFFTKDNDTIKKQDKVLWDHAYEILYHQTHCLLFITMQDKASLHYRFYALPMNGMLTIGREKGDIRYNSELVSAYHARLLYEENHWILEDLNSANGVYVNCQRVRRKRLELGDCIYIMGLQLLFGTTFIALNHKESRIVIQARLPPFVPQAVSDPVHRSRLLPAIHIQPYTPYEMPVYTLKDPPMDTKTEDRPLLYQIAPAITMSLGSLSSTMIMVVQLYRDQQSLMSAAPSLVMSATMVLGTILWPYVSHRYEKRKEREYNHRRCLCYDSYLNEVNAQLEQSLQKKAEDLRQLYQDSDEAAALWRYTFPKDACMVCIGIGTKIMTNLFQQKDSFLRVEQDPLELKKQEFMKQPRMLQEVPIYVTASCLQIYAVKGEKADRYAYAKYLLLHHVLLYAPQNALVLLAIGPKQDCDLPRFLPHQFAENGYRFLCRDVPSLPGVLMQLRQEHLPILALSFDSAFTSFFERYAADLPMALFALHEWKQWEHTIDIQSEQGKYRDLSFHWKNEVRFYEWIDKLCNVKPDHLHSFFPKQLSFMEMYRMERIPQLQIAKRWQSRKSETSLQARLGVMADGEILTLDLHEKAHGPHGIVAGMTGSGKSELLLTMLLSLACNYHPYDCAFILIDYKGGGMAKALERLPHTAGIITNLDGSMIQRSLDSFHAELMRRQRIFAEVMKEQDYPTMNIDLYQKLFHDGAVKEIIPHLIIIADEFAELKQQEPQFMEQLIRIARIGRSLGIHLILATQKPGGIVDDQIWSNAHFHICLKVADKADSMEMLKREEGVHIRHVGRFYLQVGYDEIFTEGQCAYAKAPYDPSCTGLGKVLLSQMDHDGSILKQWKRENKGRHIQSEMQALMDEMCAIAASQRICTPPLWVDPLPDQLFAQADHRGCIALVDDPLHQRQFFLSIQEQLCNTLLFASDMHMVQTAVASWLYAWIQSFPTSDQVIIIDGAQGQLCAYRNIAHVYAALSLAEKEDIRFVMGVLTRHKQSHAQNRWLLIVHHLAAFLETIEEGEAWLLDLARDHGICNITVLLSCSSVNEIHSRLYQQFENLFVFPMQDEHEAHSLIPGTWKLANIALRAMWKQREGMYEVQIIHSLKQLALIKADTHSKKMPILPDEISFHDLNCENENALAIGCSLTSRKAVAIAMSGVWILTGPQAQSFLTLLKQIKEWKQYDIHFPLSLQEIRGKEMEIVAIEPSQLSIQLHHPYVEACMQEQRMIWCGSGFEEYRYLWHLQIPYLPHHKQDALWLREEVIAFRRVSKL